MAGPGGAVVSGARAHVATSASTPSQGVLSIEHTFIFQATTYSAARTLPVELQINRSALLH